ncbi:MAG: hypothetical protein HYZ42_12870, partial [Bacteroidetes bacterium]|nr:hypothetical protein [Bacteroidota bacterium]
MTSKKKQILQKDNDSNQLYALVAVIILTFIVFSTGFNNQFTDWDDPGYLTRNRLLQKLSFESIKTMFSFDGFYGGNYHPLTALSNALEVKFFGMKTQVFHFFNLLFHLFNIYWVYSLIKRISKGNQWIPVAVAALFALHP